MAKLTHQMTENQGENKIFLKNSTKYLYFVYYIWFKENGTLYETIK